MTTEAERLRDEGIARVETASDDLDIAHVDYAIAALNRSGEQWSANDLRDNLPGVRPGLVGARVRGAARRREMNKVGYVASTLPSTHSHPIAVWKGVSR